MDIQKLENDNISDDINKKDKKTKKPKADKTDKKNIKSKKKTKSKDEFTGESKNESAEESKGDKKKDKLKKDKKSKKKDVTEVKNSELKKEESVLENSSNTDVPTYNENVSVITEIMGPDYDLSETVENVISTSSELQNSKIENNKIVKNVNTEPLKNNINLSTIDSDIINFEDNENIYKKLNDKKISQPYLTKYEKAKIIGISAQQIESGRDALVSNIPNSFTNPLQIAEYELCQKKTPIIIKRKLPNDECEYWTLEQLTIL